MFTEEDLKSKKGFIEKLNKTIGDLKKLIETTIEKIEAMEKAFEDFSVEHKDDSWFD